MYRQMTNIEHLIIRLRLDSVQLNSHLLDQKAEKLMCILLIKVIKLWFITNQCLSELRRVEEGTLLVHLCHSLCIRVPIVKAFLKL